RVTSYIDAHLDSPLKVASLAAVAGLSPFHFSRVFHETTGETPHGYVMRIRIEHAARLIREANMPLAQVAVATGFSSQSHLARRFRQHMGLSPAAYSIRHKMTPEAAVPIDEW